MKKNIISRSGFTLIELLVAVAIVAILSAIITANFTTARARARDSKRVSDIAQVQLALEFFFDRCGEYPTSLSDVNYECPANPTVKLSNFISKIPTPPQPNANSNDYRYVTNSVSGSLASDYIIGSQLETATGGVLTDDIDGSGSYGINCEDNIYNYCVGPK